MLDRLKEISGQAELSIQGASDLKTIEDLRVKFLGKSGLLTDVLKELGRLSPEKKPLVGKACNDVKNTITRLLEQKKEDIESQSDSLPRADFDPTLPGRQWTAGRLNPLTRVQKEIAAIFKEMGFDLSDGPDVETDYYNFLALNFPPDHPARDAQDTFYLQEDILMRTHTSPIQIRVMEKNKPVGVVTRQSLINAL